MLLRCISLAGYTSETPAALRCLWAVLVLFSYLWNPRGSPELFYAL